MKLLFFFYHSQPISDRPAHMQNISFTKARSKDSIELHNIKKEFILPLSSILSFWIACEAEISYKVIKAQYRLDLPIKCASSNIQNKAGDAGSSFSVLFTSLYTLASNCELQNFLGRQWVGSNPGSIRGFYYI